MSLAETIERMIKEAEAAYNGAARMHALVQVSRYSGRIEALEDVMKILIGSKRLDEEKKP